MRYELHDQSESRKIAETLLALRDAIVNIQLPPLRKGIASEIRMAGIWPLAEMLNEMAGRYSDAVKHSSIPLVFYAVTPDDTIGNGGTAENALFDLEKKLGTEAGPFKMFAMLPESKVEFDGGEVVVLSGSGYVVNCDWVDGVFTEVELAEAK